MMHNFERVDKESAQFIEKSNILMRNIEKMSLLLIKMAIQCIDFVHYS